MKNYQQVPADLFRKQKMLSVVQGHPLRFLFTILPVFYYLTAISVNNFADWFFYCLN